MPIAWNDNLKTGIPILDEQHQELIVMLNRLGRFKCGKECFKEAFAELKEYADVHFKTERDLMVSINYPEYEEHKACHAEFVCMIKHFQKRAKTCQDFHSLGEEIIDVVGDWMQNHYLKIDVELAKYIKKA